MKMRLWDAAVVWIQSMTLVAVAMADWKPKVVSVPLAAVAAQHHQTVQLQLFVGVLHGLDLVQTVAVRLPDQLEGGAGGTKNGAAHGEQAREVPGGHAAVFLIDHALVAL